MGRVRSAISWLPLIVLSGSFLGCENQRSVETIRVLMTSTETYERALVGGDEEGARIVTQAEHYRVSEIRRNAETDWVAVYVYQPKAGFVGVDSAKIEMATGSDGASSPTNIQVIAFEFIVTEQYVVAGTILAQARLPVR